MITPILIDRKVIIGPCRLSYTYLFQKHNPNNDPDGGKYQTSVLIPKDEKETVEAVKAAIEKARQLGITAKWKGSEPKKLDLGLRDGDEKDDEAYNGCWYVNAKANNRPGVVDRRDAPIVDEEEIYSGVWAYVSLTFFPYDNNGNRGIGCGLNNVKKFKDDEHLGGRVSAARDFAGIPCDDEDL